MDTLLTPTSFSITPTISVYLRALIHVRRPIRVIEFGSGVSTLAIAAALRDTYWEGRVPHLISIEHDEAHLRIVEASLAASGLQEFVHLIHAPLARYAEERLWYDRSRIPRERYDLAFVDGPPGHTCAMAREPALPFLLGQHLLNPNFLLVLDDAGRDAEQESIAAWRSCYGVRSRLLSMGGRRLAAVWPRGGERPHPPLPPPALRFMDPDDESFLAAGEEELDILMAYGFSPDASLLDAGCGYARLPHALVRTMDYLGRYLGFDVLAPQIQWSQNVIGAQHPQVRFQSVDARNDRYNPTGRIDAQTLDFPAESESFRFCSLFSVFTHMFASEIARYLHETWRVLEPGGICVASFFLFDLERLAEFNRRGRLQYELDEHVRYDFAGQPLQLIAYECGHIEDLVRAAGFEVVSIAYGTCSGGEGFFQDLVVLSKPTRSS